MENIPVESMSKEDLQSALNQALKGLRKDAMAFRDLRAAAKRKGWELPPPSGAEIIAEKMLSEEESASN